MLGYPGPPPAHPPLPPVLGAKMCWGLHLGASHGLATAGWWTPAKPRQVSGNTQPLDWLT